MIFYKMHKN